MLVSIFLAKETYAGFILEADNLQVNHKYVADFSMLSRFYLNQNNGITLLTSSNRNSANYMA